MKKILLLGAVLLGSFINANAQATCAAAATLTNGTVVVPAVTGAAVGGAVASSCFAAYTTNDEGVAAKAMWYKYEVTTAGVITVDAAIAANPINSTDTRLRIFKSTSGCLPTGWVCAQGNDDVSTTDYRSRITNLAVTPGTYYIVFDNYWLSSGFSFTFNFTAVSCFAPTSPYTYTAAPTTTTASISWTAPTGTAPTGYQVEYGPQGFTAGSGTILPAAQITGTTANFTGLNPSTVYQFTVKSQCGLSYSLPAGPITFNTVFTYANAPYSTDFENTALDYIGWTDVTPVAADGWDLYTAGTGSPLVHGGAATALTFAVAPATGVTASNAWLISRGISLTANSTVTIKYWTRNYLATGSTGTGSYNVKAGTSPTIAGQTIPVATVTGLANTAFVEKTHTFTAPTTAIYYISFQNVSAPNAGTHAIMVDDFSLTQATAGVNDFLTSKFAVYPNPTTGLVSISNTDNMLVKGVQVIDLNGRTVKTLTFDGVAEAQVNISDLTSGVYMMNITTDNGTATKKIVKQ